MKVMVRHKMNPWKYRKFILSIVTFLIFIGILSIQEAQAYSKSKSITIQSGQVIGGPYTNFPMLFKVTDLDLRYKDYGGDVQNINGYDIIFKDSNGVQLDHEVEKYVASTGEFVAWVEVPSINNGTVIYIYYGNSTISLPTENPTGVWDSNYRGVWHLHDDFEDSTSNNNDGTNSDSTNDTGKIADAQDFDGVNDYINMGSATSLDDLNPVTLEAWIKPDTLGENGFGRIWGKSINTDVLPLSGYLYTGNTFRFRRDRAITDTDLIISTTISVGFGNWTHIAVVFDTASSTGRVYINGAEATYTTQTIGSGSLVSDATYNLLIGNREATDRTFDGGIDEVRVSSTVRSAGWIQTEYNNQYAPSSFYIVGSEVGCSFSYRKSITVNSGQVSGGPHTNFPILVSLTDLDLRTKANGGDVYSSSGYDIIFRATNPTTCGGTAQCTLNHEIEYYDGSPVNNVAKSAGWFTGTGPYTVPAGTDRLLVFITGYENTSSDPGITSVTFGGASLTRAIGQVVSSGVLPVYYERIEIWYLKDANIPGVSSSFTVTYGGAVATTAHSYALFTYVNQSNPVGSTASGTTTTSDTVSTSSSFNVVEGGMGVTGAGCGNSGNYSNTAWGNGWTEGSDQPIGGTMTMGAANVTDSYKIDGTDSATATYVSGANRQVIVAAGLQPSASSGGGKLVAWVRVPSINNGTVIYMYYGNGCITSSTENPTGVWDTNYKGVWHLQKNPGPGGSGDITDSTSNHNGTAEASMTVHDLVSGKIDGAIHFDGANDYIYTANSSSGPQNFTIEAWFRTSNASGTKIFGFENNQTGTASTSWDRNIYMGTDGYVRFGCYDGTTDVAVSTNTLNNNEWHHVVGVRDDSADELRIYVDGTWNNTVSNANAEVFTGYWRIGSYKTTGWPNGVDGYFGSQVDEIRISETVRSPGWIQTEYNNQNAPSSFYATGNEENGITVIELISFTAEGYGDSVNIEWETKTEVDNLGFNLYRSTERNGTYIKLNGSLIQGLLSSVTGRKYNYSDADVTMGKLYYYKLEDIDLKGTRTMHGPVCVDWDADGIPDDEDSDVALSDSDSDSEESSSFISGDIDSGNGIPTQVKLKWLKALKTKDGIRVEWQTGYEVNNLGFHVYREENGELYQLTPELIAGSALLAGSGTALTAGQRYIWWDTSINLESSALSTIRYWVEDVDLNGARTMHGPVRIKQLSLSAQLFAFRRSTNSLSELGMKLEERYREYWKAHELREKLSLERSANRGRGALLLSRALLKAHAPLASRPEVSLRVQRSLAKKPAVKLFVNEEGWYRISQPELVAAGLSERINPRYLRLFVDGEEQPLYVAGDRDRRFDPQDYIEFYGTGIDTPYTDMKVYWLVADSMPGKRLLEYRAQGGLSGSGSFSHTVEKKDRTIYFAALKNGDEDNFFGPIVYKAQVDQILEVQHPDSSSSGDALLEISFQGVTNASHHVMVLLNEAEIGEVVFDGQSAGVVEFTIPQSLLLEGENLITLEAQGGEMDVTLIDYIKLTYRHAYTADNDTLKLTEQGGRELTIDGFSSPEILVIDITNPAYAIDVRGIVKPQGSGHAVTFRVPGYGQRTLLVLTDEKVKNPVGIAANKPSSWHQRRNRYDFVIISHRDFLEGIKPLKNLRESQGLSVALVDVEDIYDEFNFGAKSPFALKDFLSHAKSQWYRQPRFVLLTGDASFDPRNYLSFGDFDFVPTKLVDTAYLETASDDWFADADKDGLPDISVGRLPMRSAEEATTVISKIIGYEQSTPMKEVLLVADKVDRDGFNFERAVEGVGALIPTDIRVKEIFRGGFSSTDKAKAELLSSIDQGPMLVNYSGHGSVEIWRGSILTSGDADSLINGQRLPFFVNMTCLNGFFHDLYTESLAESLLKAEQGGAVAVWASSGLTLPEGQAIMNQELVRLLFNGKSLTIGEAVARAKAAISDEDIRKTWILFGDPTMKLKY